ncbi:MAG: hypothetical protein ACRDX8_12605 [Acidimicrobiales bacterium]
MGDVQVGAVTAYTVAEMAQLWLDANGEPNVAYIMGAVGDSESGGNAGIVNTTDNGGTQSAVGLWQLSTGNHTYPAAWLTPAGNAAGAVAKYRAGGFGPWSGDAYFAGAGAGLLNGSTTIPAAAKAAQAGGPALKLGAASAPPTTSGAAGFGSLLERLGETVLGVGLVVVGLYILVPGLRSATVGAVKVAALA